MGSGGLWVSVYPSALPWMEHDLTMSDLKSPWGRKQRLWAGKGQVRAGHGLPSQVSCQWAVLGYGGPFP